MTKVALVAILKDYTISSLNQRRDKVLNPLTVFTAAADGIKVNLKRRK